MINVTLADLAYKEKRNLKAQKDTATGKWKIQFYYTDWQGNRKKTTRRGFGTKREAEEWLREFLLKQQSNLDMKFKDFVELYFEDMETRLRKNTIKNKRYIIDLKITPFFGELRMNEITPAIIRKWQNTLIKQGYAPTYLKTIGNQISAIFNYAVKYYHLSSNPYLIAGSMGKKNAEEMNFWTKEEFMSFLDCVTDKKMSYVGFSILFWTGMRIGELLALMPKDIDVDKKTISITKSYQRIDNEDVITPPKTCKSRRIIAIPEFLLTDIQDYINCIFGINDNDRLFPVTKYYFEHEMQRGIKASGVKRIRLHDIRHSHASFLCEMGVPLLVISGRLGHEKISTTLEIYCHIMPNKQAELADMLELEYKGSVL